MNKIKGRGRGYLEKYHVVAKAEARMTYDSWMERLEDEKLE